MFVMLAASSKDDIWGAAGTLFLFDSVLEQRKVLLRGEEEHSVDLFVFFLLSSEVNLKKSMRFSQAKH